MDSGAPMTTNSVLPDEVTTKQYLQNFQRETFDDTGLLKARLNVDGIEVKTDNPTLYLTGVHANYFATDNKAWSVQSKTGQLKPGSKILFLKEDVRVNDKTSETTLETNWLKVDLENRTASNNHPVEIVVADTVTTAKGMNIDIDAKQLVLNAKVKTLYD